MWEYNHTDELYHYGVPGMRWGHRRNSAVKSAYQGYKQAKKDLRKAKVKRFFDKSNWLAGYENQQRAKKLSKNIKSLNKKLEKSSFKAIDAQAKYAYDKKLAKTGNKAKAEKASMKVHMKAMNRGKDTGLAGSMADKGGGNTRYYKHLSSTKGKQYAQKVEKKYRNTILSKAAAASAAVIAGSMAVDAYLRRK